MSGFVRGGKAYVRCPLCERGVEVLTSKKDKPYIVCDDCGVQMFVRYEKGVKRLAEIIKKSQEGVG